MKEFLKEYKVRLRTVGPLFIGSGKELSKKEYILLRDSILVIDIAKLYRLMSGKGLVRDFENYFLHDSRTDLLKWIKDHRMRTDDVRPCVRYQISHSDTALDRGTKQQVFEFVKDPYGLPYVPGSSIKGMLRTVLMTHELISDEKRREQCSGKIRGSLDRGGNRKAYLQREQKDIEAEIFCRLGRPDTKPGDAVNDILSGLRISDSLPLKMEDMILCQRIEYHTDGEEKKMNVLRECVKPETDIEFTVTIDSTLCPYSGEDICLAISEFSCLYDGRFREKFRGIRPGTENTVYLGGGTGFFSKTDIAALFEENEAVKNTVQIFNNTLSPQQLREHKHNRDVGLGVSPHVLKGTRYCGQFYHMGECTWEFV